MIYNKVVRLLAVTLLTIIASKCTSHLNSEYDKSRSEITSTLEKAAQTNEKLKPYNMNIPGTIFSVLTPKIELEKAKEKPRFDIAAQQQDAAQFFSGLAKGAGVSMMVSPDITGSITLDMFDVTFGEILESIRSVYGYEFVKTSYGYDVLPAKLETRIFTIDKVNVTRSGSSSINVEIEGVGNSGGDSSTTLNTTAEDTFWNNLEDTVTLIIKDSDDNGSVVVNRDSGIVVVRAMPNKLRKVAAFLDATQGITKRQVIIEARILEVTLDDKFASGINWNLDGLSIVQTGTAGGGLPSAATSSFFADQITGTFTRNNSIEAVVSLLASQGKVSVISSPRIATMNNQKAVIKVGSDEYYATNLSSATTTSTATTSTESVNMESFFSGIALDVTPQIDSQGNVMLHMHPMISLVEQDDKSFTMPSGLVSLPMAKSTIRESDSIVSARSGQVVVIGGLMQRSVSSSRSNLPVSDDVKPLTDALSAKSDIMTRSEVVILLRPILVNDVNTSNYIRESIDHINAIN